jgi:hypothetical protein
MTTAKKKTRRPAQLKTGPPDKQWNFADCPHPEQTRACYLYEYSIESDLVKAEVEAVRKRWILQESPSVKQKIRDWWQSNPKPPSSFATLPTQELREWLRKFREAIPEADPTTKLSSDLHFLLYCEHFSTKHWLEIPAAEQKLIAQQFYPDRHWTRPSILLTDPVQWARWSEAKPMSIEPLEDFLNPSIRFAPLTLKGNYVLSFNWERSNRKLTEDFGQWLEENRPKDQPGFHLTKQSTSRATSHRDLLKSLSALRLIRHFEGNVRAARDHGYVSEKSLYEDESAWRKAEKRALQEIKRFDKLAE